MYEKCLSGNFISLFLKLSFVRKNVDKFHPHKTWLFFKGKRAHYYWVGDPSSRPQPRLTLKPPFPSAPPVLVTTTTSAPSPPRQPSSLKSPHRFGMREPRTPTIVSTLDGVSWRFPALPPPQPPSPSLQPPCAWAPDLRACVRRDANDVVADEPISATFGRSWHECQQLGRWWALHTPIIDDHGGHMARDYRCSRSSRIGKVGAAYFG
jgi:hypothetical protein